jgi:hypothetical protein
MLAWETNSPKGQIYKVLKVITDSALFRSQAAQGSKIKTPPEYCFSAVRALRDSSNDTFTVAGGFTATTDGYSIVSGTNNNPNAASQQSAHPLNRMGRYLLFDREEPDGYPETGTVYVGANGLAERIRWVNTVLDDNQNDGIAGGNRTRLNPHGLLTKYLPLDKQSDADTVVRFFLALLYPGEGGANLDLYRRRGIEVLDTSAGVSPSTGGGTYSAGSFAGVPVSGANSEYHFRVRRMVATLMSLPRFHEQ